ncbi:MAG: glycosyltransferase family 2 protein [Candidatus Doudnabacteria bacterium]|nr:glycosyltransferase family 2 protein [Candidatus Doudnabacteria bacterium]
MEEKKIDLSIIILAYNSKNDLGRLLPSVFGSETKYSYEIIIVDNGSNDGTYDWLKAKSYQLKAIRNINTGFAHGNNLGIKQAQGRYILLLNPDTKIEPGTLEVMLSFMDQNQKVGISGCKVIKPDGKLDLACRRRFPNPWNSFKSLFLLSRQDYNFANADENLSMEIDSVMGAFLLVRKSVIEKIGMLDEDFFMYGEDIDWCWRCKQAGYKVWYYPKTFITHYKGSSSRKLPFKALRWFHEAMWIFYRKHYKSQYPFVLNWLVFLGIYLRLTVLIILNLFKKERTVSR